MSNWTVGDWITYGSFILGALALALIQLVKDVESAPDWIPSFLRSQKWNYAPLLLMFVGAAAYGARQLAPIARLLDGMPPHSVVSTTPSPAPAGFTQQQVDEKIVAATKSLQQENVKIRDELAAVKQQAPKPQISGQQRAPDNPYPPDPILEHPPTPKDARLMHDKLNELSELVVKSQKNVAPSKFFLTDDRSGRSTPWNQTVKIEGFDEAIRSLSQYKEQLKTLSDAMASIVNDPIYLSPAMQRIVGHTKLDELQNSIGAVITGLQQLKQLNIPLEAQFIGDYLFVSVDNLTFKYRDFMAWNNTFPWRRVPAAQTEIDPYLNARQ